MFTVYVLFSPNFDKIYVGYTSDLKKRVLSHNDLANKGWTIKYRPWKLIYHDEYLTKTKAMSREK